MRNKKNGVHVSNGATWGIKDLHVVNSSIIIQNRRDRRDSFRVSVSGVEPSTADGRCFLPGAVEFSLYTLSGQFHPRIFFKRPHRSSRAVEIAVAKIFDDVFDVAQGRE